MNALLEAILGNDLTKVRTLLRADPGLAGQPVDQTHWCAPAIPHYLYAGDQPLHLAAAGFRADMVTELLAAGVDPNAAASRRKATPLHYAADGAPTAPGWDEALQVLTMKRLLAAGARINAPDHGGATPLHRAVRCRCATAVKFLLAEGAEATVQNHSGSTPFHLAVQNTGKSGSGSAEAHQAQREIIAAFRAAGLSPELPDGQGRSVLDWAKSPLVRQWILNPADPPAE